MEKRKRAERALPLGDKLRRWGADPRLRWAVRQGILAGGGYIFTSAALFGQAHPFALAFGAAFCGGKWGFGAVLGAFAGYAVTLGSNGLHYCASLLVCAACALVFSSTGSAGLRPLMPLCTAFTLLCTGSALLMTQFTPEGLALLLGEAGVCGAMVCLYSLAARPSSSPGKGQALLLAGQGALLLSFLLALEPWRVFHILSPARAIGLLAVMTVAYCAPGAGGAGAGVAFGAAFDLSGGMELHFTGLYGVAGLIGGLCRKRGRLGFGVAFVLAHCTATLWAIRSPQAASGLYECFCASVFFLVLPEGLLARVKSALGDGAAQAFAPAGPGQMGKYAQQRLRQASRALEALALSLTDVPVKNQEDITQVFRRSADKVCRFCPVREACWDKEYVSTMGVMNDVTQALRKKGKLQAEDFPAYFAARCLEIHRFAQAVSLEYAALLRRRGERARQGENRKLLRRQYEGVGGLLRDMGTTLLEGPEYYPALENRAKSVAEAYFRRPAVALYTNQGRMRCEVRVSSPEDLPEDHGAFVRSLSLALGRDFCPPQPVEEDKGTLVRCVEREQFAVSAVAAQRKKEGETVNGDQYMDLSTDDGRHLTMLADGMGSGEGAAQVSLETLSLLSRFAQAGCSLWESARAVTPVLSARLEEKGFVTLDLLEIDLYSGRGAVTKYGAAPTWLLSGGRARKFSSRALPAGLEGGESPPEPEYFQLKDTCTLVMLSDGAAERIDGQWLLDAYRRLPSPQALAQEAIQVAEQGERPLDDRTVLVVSVQRIPKEPV